MKILGFIFLFLLASLPAWAVDAGRFQTLHIKAPAGQPLGLAYVISDMGGWNQQAEQTATNLQHDGWLAVGLDLQKYRDGLRRSADTCHDVGDELIALSQQLQRERQLPSYLTPVLVGFGQGGVLAYATITQALPSSFTAGIGIGTGRHLDLPQSLCDGPPTRRQEDGWHYTLTAKLKVPFAFVASDDSLALDLHQYQQLPSTDTMGDLPLIPMAASSRSDDLVIFISGDGGWRDLDKTIAEELHRQGLSVVGWDSLRYFWKRKTPEQLASDLGRVIDHYSQFWRKPRVTLIGFSFGADALPFAYNRLPPELQSRVSLLALLELGQDGSFEIEVAGYIGLSGDSDLPLAPELARLPYAKLVCIYGEEDAEDSSCPALRSHPQVRVIAMPGGHHFDEDYEGVANHLRTAIK